MFLGYYIFLSKNWVCVVCMDLLPRLKGGQLRNCDFFSDLPQFPSFQFCPGTHTASYFVGDRGFSSGVEEVGVNVTSHAN